jgi:hypothetical protein
LDIQLVELNWEQRLSKELMGAKEIKVLNSRQSSMGRDLRYNRGRARPINAWRFSDS